MKKRKNNFDRFFLLSWKKFVISAIIFVLVFFYRHRAIKIIFEPIGLYNFVYYGVFVGVPLYLFASLVYTLVNRKKIKKRKKLKNKFDKFLLMNWRKAGIFLISFVLATVLHNLIYALGILTFGENFWGAGGDEPFFFILAVIVIPFYFLISIIYTLIKKLRRRG